MHGHTGGGGVEWGEASNRARASDGNCGNKEEMRKKKH